MNPAGKAYGKMTQMSIKNEVAKRKKVALLRTIQPSIIGTFLMTFELM